MAGPAGIGASSVQDHISIAAIDNLCRRRAPCHMGRAFFALEKQVRRAVSTRARAFSTPWRVSILQRAAAVSHAHMRRAPGSSHAESCAVFPCVAPQFRVCGVFHCSTSANPYRIWARRTRHSSASDDVCAGQAFCFLPYARRPAAELCRFCGRWKFFREFSRASPFLGPVFSAVGKSRHEHVRGHPQARGVPAAARKGRYEHVRVHPRRAGTASQPCAMMALMRRIRAAATMGGSP